MGSFVLIIIMNVSGPSTTRPLMDHIYFITKEACIATRNDIAKKINPVISECYSTGQERVVGPVQ